MSRKRQISLWEVSLVNNWGLIKREVLVDSVVDSMIESAIVTTEEWRVVKNKHITESDKVEDLLFLIQKRGSDAIKILPNILENAGYYHITEALKRSAISADTSKIAIFFFFICIFCRNYRVIVITPGIYAI